MNGEKNEIREVSVRPSGSVVRPIRFHPSSTDYATAAELTCRVLGLTGKAALKRKPSKRLLSLAGWDA